jgi:hypothetical protein
MLKGMPALTPAMIARVKEVQVRYQAIEHAAWNGKRYSKSTATPGPKARCGSRLGSGLIA